MQRLRRSFSGRSLRFDTDAIQREEGPPSARVPRRRNSTEGISRDTVATLVGGVVVQKFKKIKDANDFYDVLKKFLQSGGNATDAKVVHYVHRRKFAKQVWTRLMLDKTVKPPKEILLDALPLLDRGPIFDRCLELLLEQDLSADEIDKVVVEINGDNAIWVRLIRNEAEKVKAASDLEDAKASFLRGESVFIHLLTHRFRPSFEPVLKMAGGPTFDKIIRLPECKGRDREEQVLSEVNQTLCNAIFASRKFPVEEKNLLKEMMEAIEEVLPEEQLGRRFIVGLFILRFLSPYLVSPKVRESSGDTEHDLGPYGTRIAIDVSRIIQFTANGLDASDSKIGKLQYAFEERPLEARKKLIRTLLGKITGTRLSG